jgi:peptidoglycan/LPS O-acetylase OafA/YrhL
MGIVGAEGRLEVSTIGPVPGQIALGVGPQLTYMPALDGLRAVSILGVLFNHGGFGWSAGGFISVNVFFVLSGFLITMLLMTEWARLGTIRLLAFWARRARRLLPALFVLLGAIGLYALYFAPAGSQSSLFGDGLSTLFYFNNWHQVLTGQSYFVQVSAASPLLHTWSLAIEEQFYLVWPLVVLGVLKLWRSPKILLGLTVLGVLASATAMALLFNPGADPSRLYYGTDTRAQDILVGAMAGILLMGKRPATRPGSRAGYSWLVIGAALVFAWEWSRINDSPSFPYRGGFLVADVMVGLVILGVTKAPLGIPSRVLSFKPLTFIGRISYGLYLWHWPVFLVLDHQRTGLDGYGLFGLRVAVTFAIALVSWHLVEMPIRQMASGGWRSWAWVPVGVVAVVGILTVTTTVVGSAAGTNILVDPGPATSSTASQLKAYWFGNFAGAQDKTKVLFVGDSLSLTMGFWLTPYEQQFGLDIRGRPEPGCGLATAVPYSLHGRSTFPPARCANWPSIWQKDIDQMHPDVVAVVVGFFETVDRKYQGRWEHLGDPAFDSYERSQMERAISVFSSRGAKVALMTAPYFDTGEQPDGQPWDEDSPTRVDLLNRMIESVAAQHPGVVTVVPLHQYLDPNGHYTATIDGKVVRPGDGIHTTQAAGTYLAPKILPQLESLGQQI